MDSKARSILKAVLWTVIGRIVVALMGPVFTGSRRMGGAMAGVNSSPGLLTYVLCERMWERISWGRI